MASGEMVEMVAAEGGGTLEALNRAEIDVQVTTAKRYPRSVGRAIDEAMALATRTPETAEAMGYALPRSGKVIRGPSVRLAEILGACWGNLRYGARIVEVGKTTLTAQGVCHDLEKNIAASVEVQRRITDKSGRRYNEDMIVVTGNAAQSIALRNAIFRVVPGVYAQEVYDAALAVAVGDMHSLSERVSRALDYFTATVGISEDRILAVLKRPSVEQITLDDLGTLTGLKTALKEGTTSVEEAFPPLEPEGKQGVFSARPSGGTKPDWPGKASAERGQGDGGAALRPEDQRGGDRGQSTEGRGSKVTEGSERPSAGDLERRRRANTVTVAGEECKTAGITGKTLAALREAIRANDAATVARAFLDGLGLHENQRDLTFLREEEGQELLEVCSGGNESKADAGGVKADAGEGGAVELPPVEFRIGDRVEHIQAGSRGQVTGKGEAHPRGGIWWVAFDEGDWAGKSSQCYGDELDPVIETAPAAKGDDGDEAERRRAAESLFDGEE